MPQMPQHQDLVRNRVHKPAEVRYHIPLLGDPAVKKIRKRSKDKNQQAQNLSPEAVTEEKKHKDKSQKNSQERQLVCDVHLK